MDDNKPKITPDNINIELLNRFLELAQDAVNAQTVTTDRLIKDEREIQELRSILFGDATTTGLIERIRNIEKSFDQFRETFSNSELQKIKDNQLRSDTQNKIIIGIGISILLTLIGTLVTSYLKHLGVE